MTTLTISSVGWLVGARVGAIGAGDGATGAGVGATGEGVRATGAGVCSTGAGVDAIGAGVMDGIYFFLSFFLFLADFLPFLLPFFRLLDFTASWMSDTGLGLELSVLELSSERVFFDFCSILDI